MNFAYQGYDKSGAGVRGMIEAPNPGEATSRLADKGLYVTTLEESAPERSSGPARSGPRFGGGGGGLKDIVAFTRQVAALTGTGTPVVQSIHAVERQLEEGHWREVVGDLRKRVEEGESLTEVMGDHPRQFNAVYRSLIAAGESGGNLPAMLGRLSAMTRQELKIRNAITGAMTYPALLIVIAFSVLIVMILFVLPRFAGLFDSLDAEIPPTTKALLAMGGFLRANWWTIPLGVVSLVGGAIWSIKAPRPRAWIDAMLIRTPVLGRLLRALTVARLSRLMGVLLVSRVPMLEALDLTREAMSNRGFRDLIDDAIDAVTHGESISTVFRRSDLIPPSVTEALSTGEQTGRIGDVLVSVADFMDEDNEVLVKAVTSLIEPLILIVLGGVVGFIAFSMFMPLFDLTAATGA